MSLDGQQLGMLLFGIVAVLVVSFLFGFVVGRASVDRAEETPVVEETPADQNTIDVPGSPAVAPPDTGGTMDSLLTTGTVPGGPASTPETVQNPSSTMQMSTSDGATESAATSSATSSSNEPAYRPATAPSRTSEAGGKHSIVVASLPIDEADTAHALSAAEARVAEYRAKGFTDAYYVEVELGDRGRYYRVIIKDCTERSTALEDLSIFKGQGVIPDGWVWDR